MKGSKGRGKAILLGLAVFVLDFVSKLWTHAYIPPMNSETLWYPYGGIGVFENFYGIEFSISHAVNYGAAWSLFSEHQDYLMVFRILFVAAITVYALFLNKNRRWDMPLALVVSGAISNIVDYFIYGHVVDMFHFVFWSYDYPVFNVADSAICIGILWLFLLSFCNDKKKKKQRA
ncbi:MAG: signal peptidase II [Chlamydiales bacterium]|nr:signal peptidase II [Chlamydiia bacterium]MCP5508071.1 signal peptidase II [Chlamydiales bacterium]